MPYAWVYIVTNRNNTVLYVGVTDDLPTRLWEHRTKRSPKSFATRYNIYKLVYYREFRLIDEAIKWEKYIKGKNRKWKIDLIEQSNHGWNDLTDQLDAK
jgi:putative endonuclease